MSGHQMTPLGDGDLTAAVACYMRGGLSEHEARRAAQRDVRALQERRAEYRRRTLGTIDPQTPTREPEEEG